jgi:hypothetical protein
MKRLGTLLLGPNEANQGIYIGDAMQIGEMIPDESVALIICDPVYWRQDHYAWLDRFGSRVLIPGGNLVAQCGHIFLPGVMSVFRRLTYVWVITENIGRGSKVGSRKVVGTTKPHVWYCKGFPREGKWVLDWIQSPGKCKSNHQWEDNPIMFKQLITRLANGGPVVDPFSGGGTVAHVCKELRLPYISMEIDPLAARQSRERLRQAQPSLFGLDQLGFEFPSEDI